MNSLQSKTYPSNADYDLAVRYIDRYVFDSVLKAGIPRSKSGVAVSQGGDAIFYPGSFAKAYVVDCGSKTYALRVWTHDIGNAARHYSSVTEFLKKHQLPYFVDSEFIPNGIQILSRGQRYPILRMEWFDAYTLRDFIRLNINQPAVLRIASEGFLTMVQTLHSKQVGHGDLQADNILLRSSNGSVIYKLIDYDTLIVPALLGQAVSSGGHPAYQHPNRVSSVTVTERDDYFSELVIYLCLSAVAERPTVWREFPNSGRDKELLFVPSDFASTAPTAVFRHLYAMGGLVQQLTVALWNFTRCPTIHLLPPLERLLEVISKSQISTTAKTSGSSNRSAFDELLKQKLAKVGPPQTWLDDSAFLARGHDIHLRISGPNVQSVQSLPSAPLISPSPPRDARGRFAARTVRHESPASFEETLSRLRAQSTAPSVRQPPLEQRRADWGLAIGAIIALAIVILILLALLSSCHSTS